MDLTREQIHAMDQLDEAEILRRIREHAAQASRLDMEAGLLASRAERHRRWVDRYRAYHERTAVKP